MEVNFSINESDKIRTIDLGFDTDIESEFAEYMGIEDPDLDEITLHISDTESGALWCVTDMDDLRELYQLLQDKPMHLKDGEEILDAWCDNMGQLPDSWDSIEDAYEGKHSSEEEFAQQYADDICDSQPSEWPQNCIDWEQAARELFYDYWMSDDGHVFRNL